MVGKKMGTILWPLVLFFQTSAAQNSCRYNIFFGKFIKRNLILFDDSGMVLVIIFTFRFSLKTCVNLCCPEGEVFIYGEKTHRFKIPYS